METDLQKIVTRVANLEGSIDSLSKMSLAFNPDKLTEVLENAFHKVSRNEEKVKSIHLLVTLTIIQTVLIVIGTIIIVALLMWLAK